MFILLPLLVLPYYGESCCMDVVYILLVKALELNVTVFVYRLRDANNHSNTFLAFFKSLLCGTCKQCWSEPRDYDKSYAEGAGLGRSTWWRPGPAACPSCDRLDSAAHGCVGPSRGQPPGRYEQ